MQSTLSLVITKCKKRVAAHWNPPPSGRLKINFDGAPSVYWHGVVARDANGKCLTDFQRSMPYLYPAIHAEAEACRPALLIAINQGWDEITVESDCSVLVAALNMPGDDFSDIGKVISDCKD